VGWESCGLVVDKDVDEMVSGIRSRTFGGKMGSSGWRIVALRRSDIRRGWERVVKYARFYMVLVYGRWSEGQGHLLRQLIGPLPQLGRLFPQ
jgi:hypothetical protein